MNPFLVVYLFSFIPVLLFSFVLWSDIRQKKQFGKRPKHFLVSISLLGLIGAMCLAVSLLETLFPPEASFPLFTLFYVLYVVTFFFAEYSIHSQRLVRSFFMAEFRPRLKRFLVLCCTLGAISLVTLAFYVLSRWAGGLAPFAPRSSSPPPFFAPESVYVVNVTLIIVFITMGFVFLLTAGRSIFFFQSGVIRQNYLFPISSGITLVLFLAGFIHQGFTDPVPLWLFTLNNCIFLIRITQEYFYRRTLNLDRTLMKLEETLHLKNDLIAKVVNSPAEEDFAIIRASVTGEIDRARAFMAVPEHGISGTVIYTREGGQLKVNSLEHIEGFCTPLSRLESLKLFKNREQFNEIIVRNPFNMTTLLATPKELLPSWGERLLKEAIETKKEVVISDLPPELSGLHTLVGLYPIFDKDYLTGLIVIFKNAHPRLFPEEENALAAIIDNLTVIFSIIKGKQIQRERNRLQGELEIAKRIQTSILPRKINIPGYECAASMTTASEVGGDAYDVAPSPFGTYLAIGDVSGHGLPSGVTALIQLTAFQSAIMAAETFGKRLEPFELYELVNKILCEINKNRIGSDKFMTENYFLVKGDTFACAGTHLIALHYKKSRNTIVELDFLINKTAFMGLSPAISARESAAEFSMQTNDLLLLYTDGIIEAKDNFSNQFGIPRLKEVLAAASALPIEEIGGRILQAVQEHAKNGDLKKYKGNLADDATMVIIRKL
ncbi:MAG: serine/threonine-protein phosphatase [Spirochaetales bacterium]|nr:serine/threonine-protein phosphatase [Spirochaetales bacterium]